jgi:hypothetical protein
MQGPLLVTHCGGKSFCFCGQSEIYRSFATRVLQLRIWHFWVIRIERNVCTCTFNRYSVITQFAKLAAGEQLCRRCTHRKLQNFKTFKSFSWKIADFELWHLWQMSDMGSLVHNTDAFNVSESTMEFTVNRTPYAVKYNNYVKRPKFYNNVNNFKRHFNIA